MGVASTGWARGSSAWARPRAPPRSGRGRICFYGVGMRGVGAAACAYGRGLELAGGALWGPRADPTAPSRGAWAARVQRFTSRNSRGPRSRCPRPGMPFAGGVSAVSLVLVRHGHDAALAPLLVGLRSRGQALLDWPLGFGVAFVLLFLRIGWARGLVGQRAWRHVRGRSCTWGRARLAGRRAARRDRGQPSSGVSLRPPSVRPSLGSRASRSSVSGGARRCGAGLRGRGAALARGVGVLHGARVVTHAGLMRLASLHWALGVIDSGSHRGLPRACPPLLPPLPRSRPRRPASR